MFRTQYQTFAMRTEKAYNLSAEAWRMTVREVIKMLYNDGWYTMEARTKGSHIQLKHPQKKGKVTVPHHRGDIAPGTLNSILKQAGLK